MRISSARLRRYAVARTFPARTAALRTAIERLGFVQADPIRAPARAQDLILRHRVTDYRAGDLERRYPQLPVEEDAFVNYGYLPRATARLMHPRIPRKDWSDEQAKRAQAILDFVAEHRGPVHPRQVDDHFDHGRVTNWFGGTSNASTQLLDAMHYRGLLRVAGRVAGTRVYAPAAPPDSDIDPDAGIDRLLEVAVRLYAPVPLRTLRQLASHLGYGVPQWRHLRRVALSRAETRFATAEVDGVRYFWPGDEPVASRRWPVRDRVRLLAPFDPLVWDRFRFEHMWGWAYRFEAYTPAAKRVRGYYALPLLWRDQIVGWGNLAVHENRLHVELGYAQPAPRGDAYQQALESELAAMVDFLGVDGWQMASPGRR